MKFLSIGRGYPGNVLFWSIGQSLQSKTPFPHPDLLGKGGGHRPPPFCLGQLSRCPPLAVLPFFITIAALRSLFAPPAI